MFKYVVRAYRVHHKISPTIDPNEKSELETLARDYRSLKEEDIIANKATDKPGSLT